MLLNYWQNGLHRTHPEPLTLVRAVIWVAVLALKHQPSLCNIWEYHRESFSVRPSCCHHLQVSRLTGPSRSPDRDSSAGFNGQQESVARPGHSLFRQHFPVL